MSDTTTRDEKQGNGKTTDFNREPQDDARKEAEQPKDRPKLAGPAAKRRARIRQLEARLERERSRESVAVRKERNGQLFVWGAMVEGVYRDGGEQERGLIRRWAGKHLTDKRHHQRAEHGFARIEDETADSDKS